MGAAQHRSYLMIFEMSGLPTAMQKWSLSHTTNKTRISFAGNYITWCWRTWLLKLEDMRGSAAWWNGRPSSVCRWGCNGIIPPNYFIIKARIIMRWCHALKCPPVCSKLLHKIRKLSVTTFLICLPLSLRVEILADFDSVGVKSGSKEFAVGVVVSAFLFTPFFT